MTRELDKTTNFDPEKSLWELNIFRLAVILAVVTAVVIALWIFYFTELEFEPS